MSLGIWKYSLIQDKLIEDIVYAKGNQGVLTKVTQKKESTCTDISFFQCGERQYTNDWVI